MKLPIVQSEVMALVNRHGYTAEELELLFNHLGKLNLPDFTASLNALLGAYLAATGTIAGEPLTGLSNLFEFTQTLQKISSSYR